MKNRVKLSYIKCSSRSISDNLDKINLLRKIFWIDFADKIDNNKLIENCNECAITRNIKQNYSWSEISSNKEFWNISFSENKSLIMAIFANDCWFY